MNRECAEDPNTNERLADVRSAEKALTPCWPLRQTALWKVKNVVFAWSRTAGRQPTQDGSLQDLPIQLRQELLDAMLKLKPDGREVMRAVKKLVKGGILSFDLGCLEECHHWDVREVVKMLTSSGHLLLDVGIRGQWLFNTENGELLFGLLRSLTNVKHLCLQETSKGAPELDLIVKHCPNLRTLEITQPSLCDIDILSLVGKGSYQLRSLKVPSSVRGPGLLALLKLFPNLVHLECVFLEELLDCFDECADRSWWEERTLGMRGIKTSYPLSHDTLTRLVKWCPNLNSVSIEIQELVLLKPITSLRSLTSLELRNSAILPVSYENNVLPLLETVGPQLKHLCLEHFDVVNLVLTSELCPALTSLELRWFTTLTVGKLQRGFKPFAHLGSLCLRPRTNRHVTREACQVLLTNCIQLEKLETYCCHGLDDSLLTQVLKGNSLEQLKVLLLKHGHGISETGLRKLVTRCCKLELWDFGAVSPKK